MVLPQQVYKNFFKTKTANTVSEEKLLYSPQAYHDLFNKISQV